ncbi:MAG: GTPase Era [Saprospiraceae bacterium]|nr:GTPase Era [Saprospiraceae bacterium]
MILEEKHTSGFVNIIGKPNVGKSTLMNALVGERMSIITNKPQTTRHRIFGIVSDDHYQVVFSDTPGYIENPSYKMQESMNDFVKTSFEDADMVLFIVEIEDEPVESHPLLEGMKKLKVPVFLVLNKTDTVEPDVVLERIAAWTKLFKFKEIVPISALQEKNTDKLFELILKYLPEGPVYFPKEQFTDRPERFFVSEIIREKILEQYHQEIPYSTEVMIESFEDTLTKSGEELARISALIFVNRKTQKSIIIGKGGSAIKKLGMESRKAIETFLERKVFLEMHVKVKEGWRDDDRLLKGFGYKG